MWQESSNACSRCVPLRRVRPVRQHVANAGRAPPEGGAAVRLQAGRTRHGRDMLRGRIPAELASAPRIPAVASLVLFFFLMLAIAVAQEPLPPETAGEAWAQFPPQLIATVPAGIGIFLSFAICSVVALLPSFIAAWIDSKRQRDLHSAVMSNVAELIAGSLAHSGGCRDHPARPGGRVARAQAEIRPASDAALWLGAGHGQRRYRGEGTGGTLRPAAAWRRSGRGGCRSPA